MKKDSLKEILDLVKMIKELNNKEFEQLQYLINEIIVWKCKDEKTISQVFDRMLSIMFVDEDKFRKLYYKLLNYTMLFNEQLSKDYESILIDEYKEHEEEEIYILKK